MKRTSKHLSGSALLITLVTLTAACGDDRPLSDGGADDASTTPDGAVPVDAAVDTASPPDTSVPPDVGPPLVMADSWLDGHSGSGTDDILAVDSDPLGNVYVAGTFEGEITLGSETLTARGESDVVVASFDPTGVVRWARSFGSESVEFAGGIAADSMGNSYVVGRFSDQMLVGGRVRLVSEGQEEIYLVSFDTEGELRWARRYGGEYSEGGGDVAVGGGAVCFVGDFQGGFVLGTTRLEPSFQFDAFAACVDADDTTILWARAFVGADNDVGTAVAVDAEGSAFVGLSFGADLEVFGLSLATRGSFDAALVKVSPVGEHVFTYQVGGAGPEEITGMDVDASGNVYLAGVFNSPLSFGETDVVSVDAHDVYVASLTPTGEHRWATSFGAMGFDQPLDLAVGADRVHVAGRFDGTVDVDGRLLTSGGGYDAFLATYDTAGNAVGAWTVGGEGTDQANGVAADPFGGAYVGGLHTAPITLGDTTLVSDGRTGGFLAHLAPEDIPLI